MSDFPQNFPVYRVIFCYQKLLKKKQNKTKQNKTKTKKKSLTDQPHLAGVLATKTFFFPWPKADFILKLL